MRKRKKGRIKGKGKNIRQGQDLNKPANREGKRPEGKIKMIMKERNYEQTPM